MRCRRADGAVLVIEARRLIKAKGVQVTANDPLPLSSEAVRSVSPDSCGASLPLRPGSWMVNCTGYLNHLDFPYEPYLSPSGTTLSIQPQSAIMHLTSFGAYFGTHLFLSDRLSDAGLYEVDLMELYNASRKVFPPTLFALAAHNLSLCVDALPASAFRECGLDFDRWYPLPRRSIAQLKFLRQHRADRERARHALDTVRARYGVRCGPLSRELPRIA